jgi:hypothetical protein
VQPQVVVICGERMLTETPNAPRKDTLLRQLRPRAPDAATLRVLGVDEFTFGKGHGYGTILVDLERGARSISSRIGAGKPWSSDCGSIRGSRSSAATGAACMRKPPGRACRKPFR